MKVKSIRVREETHTRLIREIAMELRRETMDDVINRMLDDAVLIRNIKKFKR